MFKNSSIENTLKIMREYISTKFDLKIKKQKKNKNNDVNNLFLNFLISYSTKISFTLSKVF